jgi:hypothetical protein
MGQKIFGIDAMPLFLIAILGGFLFFTPQGADIRKSFGAGAVTEGGPSDSNLAAASAQGLHCDNPNLQTTSLTAQGFDYLTRGSRVGALTYTGYVNGQWAEAQASGTALTTVPGAYVDVRASNSTFFTAHLTTNLKCEGADTLKFYMGEVGGITIAVYNSSAVAAGSASFTGVETIGSGGSSNIEVWYSQNETSPFSATTSYGSNPQINKHVIFVGTNSTTVVDTSLFSVSGCSKATQPGVIQYALQQSYETAWVCPGAIAGSDGIVKRTIHVAAVSGQNPNGNHSLDIRIVPMDFLLNMQGQFTEDAANEAGTLLNTANMISFTELFG